uniref:AP2/ERF domain-containing protein n=1 Tax=Chromera velia CCMP2878 TaxID=1169474 RepID=A0A0G4EZ57_9ALVE|eukprot:Cvel_14307.t1-p1 / transcript=Cvel_14307.t1 / gene=Cvel_14307 / organism=Chromera_velia_CCMP2878 / gene_product=Zinc finger protein 571, putative / transcript_product=Zinc finger protein 571, putative / location=Cvel_scaffold1011:39809-45005(-) / protein_length=1396 / sequence_SO=supercontig / SO=protein_coding / is_pseudo=false
MRWSVSLLLDLCVLLGLSEVSSVKPGGVHVVERGGGRWGDPAFLPIPLRPVRRHRVISVTLQGRKGALVLEEGGQIEKRREQEREAAATFDFSSPLLSLSSPSHSSSSLSTPSSASLGDLSSLFKSLEETPPPPSTDALRGPEGLSRVEEKKKKRRGKRAGKSGEGEKRRSPGKNLNPETGTERTKKDKQMHAHRGAEAKKHKNIPGKQTKTPPTVPPSQRVDHRVSRRRRQDKRRRWKRNRQRSSTISPPPPRPPSPSSPPVLLLSASRSRDPFLWQKEKEKETPERADKDDRKKGEKKKKGQKGTRHSPTNPSALPAAKPFIPLPPFAPPLAPPSPYVPRLPPGTSASLPSLSFSPAFGSFGAFEEEPKFPSVAVGATRPPFALASSEKTEGAKGEEAESAEGALDVYMSDFSKEFQQVKSRLTGEVETLPNAQSAQQWKRADERIADNVRKKFLHGADKTAAALGNAPLVTWSTTKEGMKGWIVRARRGSPISAFFSASEVGVAAARERAVRFAKSIRLFRVDPTVLFLQSREEPGMLKLIPSEAEERGEREGEGGGEAVSSVPGVGLYGKGIKRVWRVDCEEILRGLPEEDNSSLLQGQTTLTNLTRHYSFAANQFSFQGAKCAAESFAKGLLKAAEEGGSSLEAFLNPPPDALKSSRLGWLERQQTLDAVDGQRRPVGVSPDVVKMSTGKHQCVWRVTYISQGWKNLKSVRKKSKRNFGVEAYGEGGSRAAAEGFASWVHRVALTPRYVNIGEQQGEGRDCGFVVDMSDLSGQGVGDGKSEEIGRTKPKKKKRKRHPSFFFPAFSFGLGGAWASAKELSEVLFEDAMRGVCLERFLSPSLAYSSSREGEEMKAKIGKAAFKRKGLVTLSWKHAAPVRSRTLWNQLREKDEKRWKLGESWEVRFVDPLRLSVTRVRFPVSRYGHRGALAAAYAFASGFVESLHSSRLGVSWKCLKREPKSTQKQKRGGKKTVGGSRGEEEEALFSEEKERGRGGKGDEEKERETDAGSTKDSKSHLASPQGAWVVEYVEEKSLLKDPRGRLRRESPKRLVRQFDVQGGGDVLSFVCQRENAEEFSRVVQRDRERWVVVDGEEWLVLDPSRFPSAWGRFAESRLISIPVSVYGKGGAACIGKCFRRHFCRLQNVAEVRKLLEEVGEQQPLEEIPGVRRGDSASGSRLCLCLCLNASLSLLSVSTDECGTTARNVGVQLIASMGGGAIVARTAEVPAFASMAGSADAARTAEVRAFASMAGSADAARTAEVRAFASMGERGTTARNVGVQLIASMGGGAVDARNAEAPPSAHLPSSPFCSAATQEQQRSLEEFECRVGLVCFFQDVLYFPSVHSSSLQCLPAYRSIDRWKEGRICLIPSCIHSTGTPLHPRQGGRQEVSLSGGG